MGKPDSLYQSTSLLREILTGLQEDVRETKNKGIPSLEAPSIINRLIVEYMVLRRPDNPRWKKLQAEMQLQEDLMTRAANNYAKHNKT